MEALEMWFHQRMLRVSWTDMRTNEEVLQRARAERLLLMTIKCRKIAYLSHILRGEKYRLLQLILKRKIDGRKSVDERQISWLRNIIQWTG